MAVENERNPRSKALEDALRDAGSEINIDALLDVLQAVVVDCDGPALRRVKNIESFLDRYHSKSREITKWRTNDKDFDVLKTIGKGAFGMVQLVRHLPTRKIYAMKMLNKQEMVKRSEPTCFWEERYILVNANSEWIVKLYYAFQDVKYLYMVMDYMAGGDLATLMDGYDFTVQWVRFYCAEMILAVDIIHKMGFVHRDVKPDNMLLDSSGHLKLADFGTCTRMGADGLVRCDVPVGTPDYISPEVLRAQEQGKGFGKYGRECDYWSIGICLYEMLCGVTPFYHESLSFTYANIMNHQNSLAFPDPDEVTLSEAAKSLICSFLCDCSVRLGKNGNEEIKAHPFFINDVWTFDNIRETPAPVVPELRSDDDSSYFCTPDDDNKHEQGSFEPSSEFEANHLCFAGFTYTRDNPLFKPMLEEKGAAHNPDIVQSRISSEGREKVGQLLNENQELTRLISTTRGELMEQQRKLDVEIELRTRAENKVMDLITRLEQEQMSKVQLAQSSHHLNERLAFYERQLKDAKDKLALETELAVKLKKKNSELTKNVTVFDTTVRDLKEKLSQLYNRCGTQERDMANLNLQLDQERQLTVKATERAQEIQNRYTELTEEMERLRRGYSERSQEIKGLEEKLASKEKQEAVLELELKNALGRYEAEASSLRREMASLTDENKQLMNSSEEATAVQAIRDKLQDEVDEKQKVIQRLQETEKHVSVLQVDHKQMQQQLSKQQADHTAQTERIQQLTRDVEEERLRRGHLQTEINHLEIEVSRLVRLESQLQIEKRELEGAVTHFQQELSTLKATRDTLTMQVADLNENLETESSFRVIYKKECEDLQEELEGKTKALQELVEEKDREEEKFKKQIETLEREKTRSHEERSVLEKDKLDLEIEKCKMQAEKESLLRQLNESKEKLEKTLSECGELRDKVNEASNQNVNNNNNSKNINNNDDADFESQIEILNQKLAKEKVLTQQAVNKLAEVMNRKSSVTAASAPTKAGVNRTAEYKKKEKQCRQLEQDLSNLKLRHRTLNADLEKARYELDVAKTEEEKTRTSMQELLDQKDRELEALRAQLEIKSGLQNPGSLSSLTDILDEDLTRKDGWLSVPIRQNIKRYGWKRQWVVATSQKIMFFNQEHDYGNVEPILSLEISRLFHVRSVTQGDVIRANSDDIPKIFQVLYADEREQRKEAELALSVTEYKNHQMVPITFYMPTSCDICQKQLWSMMRHLPALECRLCRVKIHKEHVDKDKEDNSLAPCKVKWLPSKDPARDLLCLAENDRIQGDWVKFLSVLIQKGGFTAQERARVRSLGRSATKGRA
ncbi:rho-associated protein kinase 1 [Galendromus occidentalis]|uniref:non-specific serine/threonine protein kinase n=1 Tax=Galendromus occidentalis TaxID=34638 RepID=A0AAJ7SFQ0_9ACAR|nr:rho-associated protein kinase 1 [Galendromus occidentalis]